MAKDVPTLQESPPGEVKKRRRFRGRDILLGLAIAAAILAAAFFIKVPGSGIEGQSRSISLSAELGPAPRVGNPAPDVQVIGLNGELLRLSDFRGRPVWLNFWATWCPPCRAENPDIEATYQEFKDRGLVVLALSIAESPSTVRGYVQRVGLTYTIGLDLDSFAAARYRVVGIPTHVFIDSQGIIREYRIGALSKKSMRAQVEKVLGQ